MLTINLFPIAELTPLDLDVCNHLLVEWHHKMGPLKRPIGTDRCYALLHNSEPVAVATTSTLIREAVGGAAELNRENCIELSRLCAVRSGLCRVMLRMWREFIFPASGYRYAVSYQDADLHNGNTYRFDGWKRVGFSHSGNDPRSGRKGRDKWIWVWELPEVTL